MRYTVLASGSRGNATLVQVGDFSLLIDAGLTLKDLAGRLAEVGQSLQTIQAVLLTHTHSDHWNDGMLGWLRRQKRPLYCHPGHHGVLSRYSRNYEKLQAGELLREFTAGETFEIGPGLVCRALPVRHDGGETFGFRLEGPADLFGQAATLAHLSDLGTWDEDLVEAVLDVDLLAVEFNHDLDLERQSSRPAHLIARVLGDEGHLSNDQAARLVREVLARSTPGRLQHVVQLHLSEDCNRPALARKTMRDYLQDHAYHLRIHTAEQHRPGSVVRLEAGAVARRAEQRNRRSK